MVEAVSVQEEDGSDGPLQSREGRGGDGATEAELRLLDAILGPVGGCDREVVRGRWHDAIDDAGGIVAKAGNQPGELGGVGLERERGVGPDAATTTS